MPLGCTGEGASLLLCAFRMMHGIVQALHGVLHAAGWPP